MSAGSSARSSGTFGLVGLVVGAFLLAAPVMASPLHAGADSCLASLHRELGTVLPSGISCQSQADCPAPASAATTGANAWIDAGTGIISIANVAAPAGVAVSHSWMDAGAGRTSPDAVQTPALAVGRTNAWIDAGTGIFSAEALAPTNGAAGSVAMCTATGSVLVNP